MKHSFLSWPDLYLKLALLVALALPVVGNATTVRLQTSLGIVDIELFDAQAPLTVANFLAYVNSGAYTNSFIHRSVPGFVIQGGGYTWNATTNAATRITANPPVTNEFSATRSNLRGMIAMAKTEGDPNSATCEWFINLANNAANLDNQNGGFTVFGQVVGTGMAVVDAIAALPIVNAGSAFSSLPLATPKTASTYQRSNLVMLDKLLVDPEMQVPTVPTGLSATATSVSEISLSWTASSDNVAVTSYKIYSGGSYIGAVNNPRLIINGATANTAYSFSISACDAAGNCSPQSASASVTTLTNGPLLNLSPGWNLLGNSINTPLDVVATFANANQVASVWKWVAASGNWAYFTPSLEDGGAAHAEEMGYLPLASVGGGEGFWVHATQAFTVQLPAGTAITSTALSSMASGWNLVAVNEDPTPGAVITALSATANLNSLWAWDSPSGKWYFYAPRLAALGGTALADYIAQRSYLDFTAINRKLSPGTGFWVNKP